MPLPPDVIFVVHQIGTGADGGIQSISEMLGNTPQLRKLIITNLSTKASQRWTLHGDVEIWGMHEAQHGNNDRGLGYRVRQMQSRLYNNLKMVGLVKKLGTKVVHCNDHRSFWNCVFGAKLAGAKVILNVRDTMRPDSRSHVMWRMALRLCDKFLVLSQEMIDSWRLTLTPLSEKPRQLSKFEYIYSIVDRHIHYPVSDGERRALREKFGIAEEQLSLVCIGRVEAKKAQLSLIENVVVPLVARFPTAHVHFVGDYSPDTDAYANACAMAVGALGLDGAVTFVGYSSVTEDWYRACDVLVLASVREGLPRCVIEGLACGANIVAFDVCSVREILESHRCGRVVSQGHYADLVREISTLLTKPDEREKLRQIGPAVVASLFDAQENGMQYTSLVRALTEIR